MVLALSAEEKIMRQRDQQKAWRERNKDKVAQYYIFHRSRPEHRDRIRLWHATHRTQINSKARERYHESRQRRLAENDHPLSVPSEDTDQVQLNSSAE